MNGFYPCVSIRLSAETLVMLRRWQTVQDLNRAGRRNRLDQEAFGNKKREAIK